MICRAASGDKVVLPNMQAIEPGRQTKVSAVIHDELDAGANQPFEFASRLRAFGGRFRTCCGIAAG